jgi:large subunit ribosomal protein L6
MSRIGKMPVPLAKGVELSIDPANKVTVKGAKGTLSLQVDPRLKLEKNENEVVVARDSDEKNIKSLHGLYRVLISNLITGVTDGFKKELEIIGVGYRANLNGNILELTLGYSHPFFFVPPDGITLEVDTKTSKNPRITVSPASTKSLLDRLLPKSGHCDRRNHTKAKGCAMLVNMYARKPVNQPVNNQESNNE